MVAKSVAAGNFAQDQWLLYVSHKRWLAAAKVAHAGLRVLVSVIVGREVLVRFGRARLTGEAL